MTCFTLESFMTCFTLESFMTCFTLESFMTCFTLESFIFMGMKTFLWTFNFVDLVVSHHRNYLELTFECMI